MNNFNIVNEKNEFVPFIDLDKEAGIKDGTKSIWRILLGKVAKLMKKPYLMQVGLHYLILE